MKPYQNVAAAFGSLLFFMRMFAPAYDDARREAFEQSQAFYDGVTQELAQMQLDYARATTQEERDAIGSLVLHRTVAIDESRLSADQRAFVRQIKADRGGTQ